MFGIVYICVTNMQGDVLGLRNTSGTEVVRYNYDPFGYLLGTTGSLATTVGKNQPLRYRGYVYDEETGQYYLQSRYYNPEWGRFISADSVINGNLFAYCNNTPLVFIDPDGFNSVNPFPWTSTPFDFKTSTGDNGITYWRWYDGQGRAYVDRHFTDHGKLKLGISEKWNVRSAFPESPLSLNQLIECWTGMEMRSGHCEHMQTGQRSFSGRFGPTML